MSGYKKNQYDPQTRQSQGGVTDFYALIWKMELYVLYHQTKMFTYRENGIYQQWTTYSLQWRSVSKTHFSESWRSKFTDLANKAVKKTQSLGKNGCRQKCFDKSLYTYTHTLILIYTYIHIYINTYIYLYTHNYKNNKTTKYET